MPKDEDREQMALEIFTKYFSNLVHGAAVAIGGGISITRVFSPLGSSGFTAIMVPEEYDDVFRQIVKRVAGSPDEVTGTIAENN